MYTIVTPGRLTAFNEHMCWDRNDRVRGLKVILKVCPDLKNCNLRTSSSRRIAFTSGKSANTQSTTEVIKKRALMPYSPHIQLFHCTVYNHRRQRHHITYIYSTSSSPHTLPDPPTALVFWSILTNHRILTKQIISLSLSFYTSLCPHRENKTQEVAAPIRTWPTPPSGWRLEGNIYG